MLAGFIGVVLHVAHAYSDGDTRERAKERKI